MKLEKVTLANALALATAKLWVLCTLFVWLFPNFSITIIEWWMHGMSMQVMGDFNLTLNNFFLGGITLTVSVWITGYVFGWSWEKVSKK